MRASVLRERREQSTASGCWREGKKQRVWAASQPKACDRAVNSKPLQLGSCFSFAFGWPSHRAQNEFEVESQPHNHLFPKGSCFSSQFLQVSIRKTLFIAKTDLCR